MTRTFVLTILATMLCCSGCCLPPIACCPPIPPPLCVPPPIPHPSVLPPPIVPLVPMPPGPPALSLPPRAPSTHPAAATLPYGQPLYTTTPVSAVPAGLPPAPVVQPAPLPAQRYMPPPQLPPVSAVAPSPMQRVSHKVRKMLRIKARYPASSTQPNFPITQTYSSHRDPALKHMNKHAHKHKQAHQCMCEKCRARRKHLQHQNYALSGHHDVTCPYCQSDITGSGYPAADIQYIDGCPHCNDCNTTSDCFSGEFSHESFLPDKSFSDCPCSDCDGLTVPETTAGGPVYYSEEPGAYVEQMLVPQPTPQPTPQPNTILPPATGDGTSNGTGRPERQFSPQKDPAQTKPMPIPPPVPPSEPRPEAPAPEAPTADGPAPEAPAPEAPAPETDKSVSIRGSREVRQVNFQTNSDADKFVEVEETVEQVTIPGTVVIRKRIE